LVPMDSTNVPPGSIRNSSLPYAVARLTEMGCDVVATNHIKDSPHEFESYLTSLWKERIHITLTTGGVSMGKADFVKDSLKKIGVEIAFHKLAIKPGKPILFGHNQNGLVFGCPGNPVSTAVALEFFVQEAVNSFFQTAPKEFQLPLAKSVTKPKDMTCLLRGRITPDGKIEAFSRQASADVCSFAMAQHWVVLDTGVDMVPAGQKVTVRSLH
jgi:molybdopterin molybdotransferase